MPDWLPVNGNAPWLPLGSLQYGLGCPIVGCLGTAILGKTGLSCIIKFGLHFCMCLSARPSS